MKSSLVRPGTKRPSRSLTVALTFTSSTPPSPRRLQSVDEKRSAYLASSLCLSLECRAPIDVANDADVVPEGHAITADITCLHHGHAERRLVSGRERDEVERRASAPE